MEKEEKVEILEGALEKLAEVEEMMRLLDDDYINHYVANHIDSQGICVGDGLYSNLEKAKDRLENKDGEYNE